jgi:hypothetical protein
MKYIDVDNIIGKLNLYFKNGYNCDPPKVIMPFFTFPIGMSIVFNLNPTHTNPFKLNLKIYTNITF